MERETLQLQPQLAKEKCPEGHATKPSTNTPFSIPVKLRMSELPSSLHLQYSRTFLGFYSPLITATTAHHWPPCSSRWKTKTNIRQTFTLSTSSPVLCMDRHWREDRGRRWPRCTFTSPREESTAFIFSSSSTGERAWRGDKAHGRQEKDKRLGNGMPTARSESWGVLGWGARREARRKVRGRAHVGWSERQKDKVRPKAATVTIKGIAQVKI